MLQDKDKKFHFVNLVETYQRTLQQTGIIHSLDVVWIRISSGLNKQTFKVDQTAEEVFNISWYEHQVRPVVC